MGRDYQAETAEMLSKWIRQGWLNKAQKKNAVFARKIQALTARDISFGDNPEFFTAHMEGNCTAVGEKTYGDTKTQRTISFDFSTVIYLFLSPGNTAERKTCKDALKYINELKGYDKYHSIESSESLATQFGKQLARQNLSDLNFSMDEFRLNRWHQQQRSEMYRPPIWPIYGQISKENGKPQKVHLGYWYRNNGEDYVGFEIDVPMTKKGKWILAGVIGAAVLILMLILFFL